MACLIYKKYIYSMDDILVYTIPWDSALIILHFDMDLAILHHKRAKYGQMFPNAENKSLTSIQQ